MSNQVAEVDTVAKAFGGVKSIITQSHDNHLNSFKPELAMKRVKSESDMMALANSSRWLRAVNEARAAAD